MKNKLLIKRFIHKNYKWYKNNNLIIPNMSNLRNNKYRSSDLIDGLDITSKVFNTSYKPAFNNLSKLSFTNYVNYCDHTCPDNNYEQEIPNFKKTKIIREYININENIKSLQDLICLIDKYPLVNNVEYNIDMITLHKLKPYLESLNSMIGLNSLKNHIIDQIIYYLQGFHKSTNSTDFLHTVIYGPPGTGKTEVAKIIGSIFASIDILSKGTFKKVTRADLIAGYLGQTALKTKDVINESVGGVLFIDEAYSLGNSEKRDSFAKECIDTLCESLTFHKDNLMVIVAGYEDELNNCFFSFNQGLNSRFTWRFNTDDYNSKELKDILIKKIKDINWTYEKDFINENWFENNKEYFKSFGRDIETFLSKIKVAHSRRVFCLDKSKKTIITKNDIEEGFKIYLANNQKIQKSNNEFMQSMYG